MIDIGIFTPAKDGYIGTLKTLGLTAELELVPFESTSERAPDFRVLHLGREVGGAWRRQSKTGTAFLTVTIADPSLPCTIRACLFQPRKPKSTEWPLVWDRSERSAA
jgi:uncharacterized protein (DUF736 family)